jgi:hypothetical protein
MTSGSHAANRRLNEKTTCLVRFTGGEQTGSCAVVVVISPFHPLTGDSECNRCLRQLSCKIGSGFLTHYRKIHLWDKPLHGYCAEFDRLPAWRRFMRINRENLKWLGRMMLILLLVGVAEILVVLFVPKPLPSVALIPVLIPLFTTANDDTDTWAVPRSRDCP